MTRHLATLLWALGHIDRSVLIIRNEKTNVTCDTESFALLIASNQYSVALCHYASASAGSYLKRPSSERESHRLTMRSLDLLRRRP